MSDELPETKDKAVREWLAAISLVMVLGGVDLMIKEDRFRFWTGAILIIMALPVYLSAAWWRLLKPKLNVQALATINAVAIRVPWWVRTLIIVGLILALSTFVIRLAFMATKTSPGIQLSEQKWPILTKSEVTALAMRVRFVPSQNIVIACETINCMDLSNEIADILQKTSGWKVEIMHRGGIGITGVTGIRLNPNEPATQSLKEAIEVTTSLKVEIGPDARKDMGTDQTFLVVGNRPF